MEIFVNLVRDSVFILQVMGVFKVWCDPLTLWKEHSILKRKNKRLEESQSRYCTLT